VSYALDIGDDVQEQIAALPTVSLHALAEALVVLEITPWSGPSLHAGNAEGAVRNLPPGGPGMVTYLIVEDPHDPPPHDHHRRCQSRNPAASAPLAAISRWPRQPIPESR
jgi:hypothetical protein